MRFPALLTRRRRPMTRAFGVLAAAALVLLMAPVGASAEPDELIPCRLFVSRIEPGVPPGGRGMTKFVCEGTFLLPSAGAVPLGSTGVAPNGSTGAHWDMAPVPPGNRINVGGASRRSALRQAPPA